MYNQAKHFGHGDVEYVVLLHEVLVAEVLHQQWPGEPMAVSGGVGLEERRNAQVIAVIQVDDPFCRHIVRTEVAEVVVGKDGAHSATVRVYGEAHFPDAFYGVIVGPHILIVAYAL